MQEYALGKYRGAFAVVWYEEGQRNRRTLGTSDPREASRRLEEFIELRTKLQAPTYTVGDLWEQYRVSLGSRVSANTMRFEWPALKDRFSHLLPSQVTDAIVHSHIKARRKAGRKDGTIWTELGRLRLVFAWALKKGLIDKAPYVARPAQPAPMNLFLTKGQMQTLVEHLSMPHLKLFAVLAWTTGARSGALLGLTWRQVDFDRGLIDLNTSDPSSQPRKGRAVVPMNETCRAALIEAQAGAISEYVIEWAGQRVHSVKKGLKAAAKKNGTPWVSPHVFRHSAAVAMAEAGISMDVIAQYLGHSDARLTARVYARFSPTYLKHAAGTLEL